MPSGYDSEWYYYDFAVLVVKTGSNTSHNSLKGWDDAPVDDYVCPFSVDFDQISFVEGSDYGTIYAYPGYNSNEFRYCQGAVSATDIQGYPNIWLSSCTLGVGSSGGALVPYGTTDIFTV